MSFSSIASMLSAAQESGQPLYAVIRDADCQENGYDAAASYRQIAALWTAMQQSSRQYCASDRSNSGLIGGTYFQRVTEEALKVAECNACMKRIVAAPTAGSCGVLPAVLIPLVEVRDVAEETILQALYIAAGFGQVTALRASVAGAEGGCQAEIGTASAMAAAALTHILGGTAQQCADAYAIALGNLLGLVCDPVAGLVEVPCVKRNVIGAVNAVSAANMAVAGITSRIPVDEVIDAMGEVGDALPASLRETGLGGLAATPTGRQAAERIARAEH
ncbi:MAG: L-serine ammonia-lyase, iron-sulfur-dependent, subunit alpha [Oscillospiraceae bacterium]